MRPCTVRFRLARPPIGLGNTSRTCIVAPRSTHAWRAVAALVAAPKSPLALCNARFNIASAAQSQISKHHRRRSGRSGLSNNVAS